MINNHITPSSETVKVQQEARRRNDEEIEKIVQIARSTDKEGLQKDLAAHKDTRVKAALASNPYLCYEAQEVLLSSEEGTPAVVVSTLLKNFALQPFLGNVEKVMGGYIDGDAFGSNTAERLDRMR